MDDMRHTPAECARWRFEAEVLNRRAGRMYLGNATFDFSNPDYRAVTAQRDRLTVAGFHAGWGACRDAARAAQAFCGAHLSAYCTCRPDDTARDGGWVARAQSGTLPGKVLA